MDVHTDQENNLYDTIKNYPDPNYMVSANAHIHVVLLHITAFICHQQITIHNMYMCIYMYIYIRVRVYIIVCTYIYTRYNIYKYMISAFRLEYYGISQLLGMALEALYENCFS